MRMQRAAAGKALLGLTLLGRVFGGASLGQLSLALPEPKAAEYSPADIGNPAQAGALTLVGGGYDVVAGGSDIGGTADQFHFDYQSRSGGFDVRVRLQSLELSDPFAKAGLMARETLAANSRFAAVLATPSLSGCLLTYRTTAGSRCATAGFLPVNYPATWLRLQRTGSVFNAYAGFDGRHWTQLGTASLSVPDTVYFGLAACSHNTNRSTGAQFRELGAVSEVAAGGAVLPWEALGPASRRTGLVISEIMYAPARRADGKQLEYVELYNSNPWWEELGGCRLGGDIQFTFPTSTILAGGGFLVVAKAPADVQSVYGVTNVIGPYAQALKKAGLVQLLSDQGAVLLEVPYASTLPWPAGADGTGHSIVLARPSYGEADPRAWAISDAPGGSPGLGETCRPSPLRNVLINEFLAHPDASANAYVELYNHSPDPVDLSGCALTDNAMTNNFILPTNTVIAAGGFLAFDAGLMGFAPDPAGGLLLFKAPDGSQVLDAVSYEPQALGVSFGRWPDGASEFYPLALNTPGDPNADIRIGDIVLNEIMYRPISGDDDDQYVELYNQGTNGVDLCGWSFTAGIQFTFAPNTVIAPGAYLVLARNLTNLAGSYPQLTASNTVGNFGGRLPHNGGRLALARPDDVVSTNAAGTLTTNIVWVVEDEVTYEVGGRWGQWAHGGGSSLELINPNTNHRLADNWADSDETAKSSWTNLEFTGVLDNGSNYGSSVDLVQLGLLDAGECLVDNVEVHPGTNGVNYLANPDFEKGLSGWTPQGSHIRSSLETNLGGYQSSQCLRVRASDGIWTLFNSVQATLTNTTLRSGSTATLRLKGRWLRGSPEMLMRLHGNWLELTGTLPVPANLGTPGLPNSQARDQVGPAIFEVKHSPPIPPANEAVLVSARFHDANGVQPTLLYRIDTAPNPAPTYTTAPMVDDGTGGDLVAGDGVYSALIPGQSAGNVVAFIVRAQNPSGSTTTFPSELNDNSGLPRECVVAFGDPIPGGSFGHQHLWLTQNWSKRWANLGGLSNEDQDGTLADGSGRIIYNMRGRYAGSPYHQYLGSPVTTTGGMHWTMPTDDQLYGTTTFNKQHVPGNGPLDDDTLQREQTSYWMARQIGVPWNYRRYYILYVNGNRHGPLMEDGQVPNGDMLNEYWPDDNNGFLYKNMGWFEGAPKLDSSGSMAFSMPTWCLLGKFTTTINGVPGQYKLARYRWMYWIRQYPDSANNFTNILALITAANASTSSPAYYTDMEALVDTEEWMQMSALEHATGDWDSFFTQNQWNMYLYKPLRGKLTALKWDWNITLGSGTQTWPADGSQLFNIGSSDAIMARFQNYAPYRRAYLRAFKDIAARAMNNTYADPLVDAKYAAFAANGLTTTAYGGLLVHDPSALKRWIGTMHNSLLRALTNQGVANLAFTVNGPTNSTTDTNLVVVSGTAPIEVQTITVNGASLPLTWTSAKAWTMRVPLVGVTNVLTFGGRDLHGQALSNLTATITITDTNASFTPLSPVFINEWMAANNHTLANPIGQGFDDWFELYNAGTNTADLAGYQLTSDLTNTAKFIIPPSFTMAPNSFLLVWADKQDEFNNPTNGVLHVNFKLAKDGDFIGLFAPDGTLVDSVAFGTQTNDVSQGRYPDGSLLNWFFMDYPTPGEPNIVALSNVPPVLAPIAPQIVDEGLLLTFTASATDADAGQTLSFSLGPGAPEGATIDAHSGVFAWRPNEAQGPGIYSLQVRVTDDGTPPLTVSRTVLVQVNEVNLPPVLAPIADQTLNEGDLLSFRAVATDPDLPPQPLTFSLAAGAPAGASINSTNGIFTWKPTEAQGPGAYTITVRVQDGGTPPLGDEKSFVVNVAEVNSPPVLLPIGDQFVIEGGTLSFTAVAQDPDIPAQNLTFSLDTGAPAGAAIEPATGVFTWTPAPNQVPSTNFITIRVTDSGVPRLDASETIRVMALKPNRPPLLEPIAGQTVAEGQLLRLSLAASDPDAGQSLVFRLVGDSPAGASINATNGIFSWTPSEAQGPSTNLITVEVSDDGLPSLSDRKSFTVVVTEVNAPPVLGAIADQFITQGDTLTLKVQATDPDLPANSLRFNLGPGAPAGLQIEPTTGTLTWTPATNQAPSANNITVCVTDDGQPPLSASRSFTVWVSPAPQWQFVSATGTASSSLLYIYLETAGEAYIDDLMLVPGSTPAVGTNTLQNGDFETQLSGSWVVSANHADSSLTTRYTHSGKSSLHVVASTGGTTKDSSIYQDITPTLVSQAAYALSFWYMPGTNSTTLTVRLSGRGISSTNTITPVTNLPPVLAAITDKSVKAGSTLAFIASATDPDLPAQTLLFSLGPDAPAGATINPQTGAFAWTPLSEQAPSTNRITVRVMDSGSPALIDQKTFQVSVLPVATPPRIVRIEASAEGPIRLTWSAVPGVSYVVQYKRSLADSAWIDLLPGVVADCQTATLSDPRPPGAGGYYRIRAVVPP